MKKFGNLNSTQLELVSSIIYVDREVAEKGKRSTLQNLSRQVHEIKPHFNETEIIHFAETLAKDKLLQTVG